MRALTTEEIRNNYAQSAPGVLDPEWAAEFDVWFASVRAEAVMGFANHYLKYDEWRNARRHADEIREGNE